MNFRIVKRMITKYPEMLKTRHIDCLTRSWIISNFRLFFFKIIIYFGPPPKTTFLGEIAVFNKFKLRLGEHDLATLGMAWISLQRISSVHDMVFFNYQKQRKKIQNNIWSTMKYQTFYNHIWISQITLIHTLL